ncbi:hypothetical protein H6P81_019950 [Aristolochia fimbriata]|uniref:DRBM domain-containing protein n=1 Tax=Aristolochia fimbriata TaxID=158543 RepID=A0AAV7DT77_ARIFI|nr:hypothetical protein H6P81_019950 [Aristolochia fimbriata]
MATSTPFALICCLSLFLVLASCKTLKRDVKALNEIKASLGWRVVYAWVGDDPCGDGDLPPWSGVTCSNQGDYRVVTELEVYAVSIVGPFPTAVTNLLDLTRLDLHNNKLTGPIPPQIGRLKRLRILNLRWNKLQDVIPSEIGELKKLTHLYLSFNNFKGEIPKELANLPELRYLYLHENRFSGRIPPELGNLPNLRHLDVSHNHLVGTIRELIRYEGSFLSLRNLYLNNNFLTGGVPAQLANLTNLEILYLSSNKMSGIIPSALANIPQLTYLYLDHNLFSGRIPDALYKHPFLKVMYIEGNQFKPGVNPKGVPKVLERSPSRQNRTGLNNCRSPFGTVRFSESCRESSLFSLVCAYRGTAADSSFKKQWQQREREWDSKMYKTRLQELCHQKSWSLPKYETNKDGPDHVPCFAATVTVNGMSFHTLDSCKSSKEAQNEVARIAFVHFTAPHAPASPSGSCSTSNELSASAVGERFSQVSINSGSQRHTSIVGENVETGSLNESAITKDSSPVPNSSQYPVNALGVGETMETGEMQICKNQLQNFALKKNLGLPKYVCHHDGPPHACRFKALVTVGGQTYESPGFLRTVKEAEHAAAKAAFLSLSEGAHEEEAAIYKNLLQELCQKEGFPTPVYKTSVSGESHIPIFSSTVKVDGKLYAGVASKTKKKAEMSAAKVAWFELKERRQTVLPTTSLIVEQMEGPIPEHTQPLLQSVASLDLNQMKSYANPVLTPEFRSEYPSGGNTGKEQQEIKSSTTTPDHNKETMDHLTSPQRDNLGVARAIDKKAERIYECPPNPLLRQPTPGERPPEARESSKTVACKREGPGHLAPLGQGLERASPNVKRSDEVYARLRDPFPEYEAETQSYSSATDQRPQLPSARASCSLLCNRILVYPRASDMKLPPDASPLPIDDDMWIAVRLEYPEA